MDPAPAVWSLQPGQRPSDDASSFTALVMRLACNDGVTGEVFAPVLEFGDDEVVVTFTVKATSPGAHTCPLNDEVPYLVDLGQPIGNRRLVDGACRSSEAATTAFCVNGDVRA